MKSYNPTILAMALNHAIAYEIEKQKEEQLRKDKLLYGESFEVNGERVDPRNVTLDGHGNYLVKDEDNP